MNPRGKDYTGQRFGILTAIEPTAKRSRNAVVWRMRCDCGAVVERAPGCHGTRGGAASCGCLNRGRAHAAAIDLTGTRYGRLTVLSCEDNVGQGLRWRCRCYCGAETIARTKDLRAGTTTSCGCGRAGDRERVKRAGWRERTIMDGDKFGRLTVRFCGCIEKGARYYWCDCECGGATIVRGGLLASGQTKSCGCLRGKPAAAKKVEARLRALQTAGSTAAALRSSPENRCRLNAEMGAGRVMTCESA